jgi:hypothetical protein
MAKSSKDGKTGVGPYAGGPLHVPMTRDTSQRTYSPPKDISKKVDKAWRINDGFDGALPKSEE